MIENYEEKKNNNQIQMEFAATGNIAVLERKFDASTGIPVLSAPQETSVTHIDELLADLNRTVSPFLKQIEDLKAMRSDVEEMEKTREKLIAENSKKEVNNAK